MFLLARPENKAFFYTFWAVFIGKSKEKRSLFQLLDSTRRPITGLFNRKKGIVIGKVQAKIAYFIGKKGAIKGVPLVRTKVTIFQPEIPIKCPLLGFGQTGFLTKWRIFVV